MKRENLRTSFQKFPVWVLVLLLALIGLPLHIFIGVLCGIRDGLINWTNELNELLS